MSAARRELDAGRAPAFWIVADAQTAGRGRRGAAWSAPSGNLMATGVYRLAATPAEAAQLSFAMALAVSDVALACAADAPVTVKWPNDVLIDGAKLSGILLEAVSAPRGVDLMAGVGINVAHAPEVEGRRTVSLADLNPNAPPDRDAVLEQVIEGFERWMAAWAREGFGGLRPAWLARAHGLKGRVQARLPDRVLEGLFVDLAPDGALIMDTGEGRVSVHAGDVFFASGASSQ